MKYVITGTSSGLGYLLAEKLTHHGQVAGISRSLGKAHLLYPTSNFQFIRHDFASLGGSPDHSYLVQSIMGFIGKEPFALILNAASFYADSTRLVSDQVLKLFRINLFSSMDLIRDLEACALRRVLFINSVSGILGQEFQHEYVASKHALMGYARSLAKQAKASDYDVMTINPGGMKTELWCEHEKIDCSDFMSPGIVADICVSLLMIPERVFVESMLILPPSDV